MTFKVISNVETNLRCIENLNETLTVQLEKETSKTEEPVVTAN